MLRVELGGGAKPREGFVNVDVRPLPTVRHVVDFEQLPEADACPSARRRGPQLPFADDSVDEAYSSHCLEHCDPYKGLLHEIVRVCKAGAKVEVRVPHWLSDMAHCAGHKHSVGETQVRHWCVDFVGDWWGGCKKRFALRGTEFVRSAAFAEAAAIWWQLTPEQVMRFIPGTCHEVAYKFEVIPHAG